MWKSLCPRGKFNPEPILHTILQEYTLQSFFFLAWEMLNYRSLSSGVQMEMRSHQNSLNIDNYASLRQMAWEYVTVCVMVLTQMHFGSVKTRSLDFTIQPCWSDPIRRHSIRFQTSVKLETKMADLLQLYPTFKFIIKYIITMTELRKIYNHSIKRYFFVWMV